MTEDDNSSIITAADLLRSLFEEELMDAVRYDPEVIRLVQEHLGQTSIHSRAGNKLADALIQLAKQRCAEKKA